MSGCLRGRIGNRVRNPDGTAAVCVEAALVDESQSLGKPEKAEHKPQGNNLNYRIR
jgi:hypothetical protein